MNAMSGAAYALRVLELVALSAQGMAGAAAALEHGRRRLEIMARDGRDPTGFKWAELDQRLDALRVALHRERG